MNAAVTQKILVNIGDQSFEMTLEEATALHEALGKVVKPKPEKVYRGIENERLREKQELQKQLRGATPVIPMPYPVPAWPPSIAGPQTAPYRPPLEIWCKAI